MKNIFLIISLGLLLIGCSVTEHTASDGTSYTMVTSKWDDDFNKCKMDEYWYDQAEFNMPPVAAVADCYQQKQTYQLCNDWDFAYQNYYYNEKFVMLMRNSISEALIRKSEDPLKCRNPNNDAITKAKIEVDLANQKARNAQARAAETERRAKKKERCLRAAEQGRVKAWSC
jgi:uncharacterized protein YceK